MEKKRFELQILDEYAKRLNSKQVKMLCESKLGKNYKVKLINEKLI